MTTRRISRSLSIAAALLLAACARPEPPFLLSSQARDAEACVRAVSAYLPAREALAFCENDSDCVEIVPEPCLSSYYANVATAERSLASREKDLAAQCGVPESACVRTSLGWPRCDGGRCRRGGRVPRLRGMSCWAERWQIVTLDRPHVLHAWRSPPDLAPENARLTVEAPGHLTVRVDWGDCTGDNELQVYELHPQPPERQRLGNLEVLRFPVSPGDYTFRLRPASINCEFATLTAHLDRADGAPASGRFHGLEYQRLCED
jgi:hypothetical protein